MVERLMTQDTGKFMFQVAPKGRKKPIKKAVKQEEFVPI